MEMGGGVAFDIVTVIAALLFLLTAWALITGKHDRYYRQFRRHGTPARGPSDSHRNAKSVKKR